jgi:hypothetical protein
VESSDVPDELRKTLEQLIKSVDAMKKNLPEEQAATVVEDLGELVNQATKEFPNKRRYLVSAEGLIKAAQNVGKIGKPVIKLAGRVLRLLALT